MAPPALCQQQQQVDDTLEVFDALLAQHRDVSQRSRALHGSCDQLLREKDALAEFADAIRTKLKFFDEFEQVRAAWPHCSVGGHCLSELKCSEVVHQRCKRHMGVIRERISAKVSRFVASQKHTQMHDTPFTNCTHHSRPYTHGRMRPRRFLLPSNAPSCPWTMSSTWVYCASWMTGWRMWVHTRSMQTHLPTWPSSGGCRQRRWELCGPRCSRC